MTTGRRQSREETENPMPTAANLKPPGAMTVAALVADDDPAFRTLLSDMLHALPDVSDVLEAEDGSQAIQLALQESAKLVVLDLKMPRLGGVEAALVLQELAPSAEIAICSSDVRALADRAGALELPLFDKLDFDRLVGWAAGCVRRLVEANVPEHTPAQAA